MATDSKLVAAELAAAVTVGKNHRALLPFFEQGAISNEEITSIMADVVTAVDGERDKWAASHPTPAEGAKP